MKEGMVNSHKRSWFPIKFATILSLTQPSEKKRFTKLNSLRFSKKAKCLIAFAIIAVILVSAFAFLPNQSGSKGTNIVQPTDTATDTPSPTSTKSPNATPSTNYGSNVMAPIMPHSIPVYAPIKGPGVVRSASVIDKSVWMQIAKNAWNSFAIRAGVDEGTGLPYAGGADFGSFTDWDLGVYIQSIIDAQTMGLVDVNGQWGSYGRIDKVLTFLETRDLQNSTLYPYWFYDARTGQMDPVSSTGVKTIDLVDTGRLFVALNNLRNFKTLTDYNSTLPQRINNIVFNNVNNLSNRTNYASFVPDILASNKNSNSVYTYYVINGFASFFPKDLSNLPNTILNNLFNSPKVNVSYQGILLNVTLPNVAITSEPLYCAIFELNNNDSRLLSYAKNLYLAHEAYYNLSGSYAAFSEGDNNVGFIYEWVIGPNGGFWEITNAQQTQYYNINPIIYTKIAFSFLALYNTTYAKDTCVYLEDTLPDASNGYCSGADFNLDPTLTQTVTQVGSNTNGLILDAALYVYQH